MKFFWQALVFFVNPHCVGLEPSSDRTVDNRVGFIWKKRFFSESQAG